MLLDVSDHDAPVSGAASTTPPASSFDAFYAAQGPALVEEESSRA